MKIFKIQYIAVPMAIGMNLFNTVFHFTDLTNFKNFSLFVKVLDAVGLVETGAEAELDAIDVAVNASGSQYLWSVINIDFKSFSSNKSFSVDGCLTGSAFFRLCFFGAGLGSFCSTIGIYSNFASSSDPHALQLRTSFSDISSVPHIMHLYLYWIFFI